MGKWPNPTPSGRTRKIWIGLEANKGSNSIVRDFYQLDWIVIGSSLTFSIWKFDQVNAIKKKFLLDIGVGK